MDTPLEKSFKTQRYNAGRRGIPFHLTFEEWLEVWENSGKLAERGRGPGAYVMARYGDAGAYEVGNVLIITNAQNTKESWRHNRAFRLARHSFGNLIRGEGPPATAAKRNESLRRHFEEKSKGHMVLGADGKWTRY